MIEKQMKQALKYPQPLSVLYVEDNQEVRKSTAEMLALFFRQVDVVKNGLCGIESYKKYFQSHKEHYDIVFTDIKMPKINGLELSRMILEENPKQHIVVISAHNEAHYLLELINIGIVNFVLKPIDFRQFKAKVDTLGETIRNQKIVNQKQKSLIDMNQLLLEAQKKAQEASEQKSRFLANMSHEIRTPLNAIRGFIALLHQKETDKEKLRYFDVINNASDSLLQIINDVLDISKIEEGKMVLDEINFDPYSTLMGIVELFQTKASQKGVVLSVDYTRGIPKVLYGDIFKLKQIFTNLISNALKFTPSRAKIHCSISYIDHRLVLGVKDEGIGISKANQKHIFDSFSQAENSTTREYGGTGLGLSISRKLTQILGGTLDLESQIGKGSHFVLSVPLAKGQESVLESKVVNKAIKINKGHILIVEDTEASRMFVAVVLENAGISYDMAVNGLEAISKFKTASYDMILMDENMPKCSGSQASKRIRDIERRENRRPTPIISLTANAFAGDKERFLSQGMDDYLSKPIAPHDLIAMIQKHLG